MRRLLAFLVALAALAAPARADDISAAGRSVVRVVVIAFEDGEVSGFGHGSGFAVAPNRVVTNAHVVAQAAEGADVAIGVVPSEGAKAIRAGRCSINAGGCWASTRSSPATRAAIRPSPSPSPTASSPPSSARRASRSRR